MTNPVDDLMAMVHRALVRRNGELHITKVVAKGEDGGPRPTYWYRWECSCKQNGTWRISKPDTENAARLHRLAAAIDGG